MSECPAVIRAIEMMALPMNQLPESALKYAALLSERYGMCGEMFVSAWAAYAQIVEELPCNDDLYMAGDAVRCEWLEAQLDFEMVNIMDKISIKRKRME